MTRKLIIPALLVLLLLTACSVYAQNSTNNSSDVYEEPVRTEFVRYSPWWVSAIDIMVAQYVGRQNLFMKIGWTIYHLAVKLIFY